MTATRSLIGKALCVSLESRIIQFLHQVAGNASACHKNLSSIALGKTLMLQKTVKRARSDLRQLMTTVKAEPVAEALSGGVEIIERLAEEWRALCAEGPCDQPFFRPEWIAAYVRAFAPEKKLLILTTRLDGRLRAVLPMVKEWT